MAEPHSLQSPVEIKNVKKSAIQFFISKPSTA